MFCVTFILRRNGQHWGIACIVAERENYLSTLSPVDIADNLGNVKAAETPVTPDGHRLTLSISHAETYLEKTPDNNTLHTEPRAARLLETMIFAAAR